MYAYNAALLCDDCGARIREELDREGQENTGDSDDYPQSCAGMDDASDTPDHCDHCHEFLETGLTDYGVRYTIDAVIDALGRNDEKSIALTVWAPYYGIAYTRDEGEYYDRFDTLRGIYWACADYHTGQFSRGYKHLCKIGRYFTPSSLDKGIVTCEDRSMPAYIGTAVNLIRGGA